MTIVILLGGLDEQNDDGHFACGSDKQNDDGHFAHPTP
jgi:hypothetical protein